MDCSLAPVQVYSPAAFVRTADKRWDARFLGCANWIRDGFARNVDSHGHVGTGTVSRLKSAAWGQLGFVS